jgi:antitoxin component of MazEF toxin-antitoxin module
MLEEGFEMVTTKLRKHGTEWFVPLSADISRNLGVTDDTEVVIAVNGRELRMTLQDAAHQARLEAALEATNEQFGAALQKLAE